MREVEACMHLRLTHHPSRSGHRVDTSGLMDRTAWLEFLCKSTSGTVVEILTVRVASFDVTNNNNSNSISIQRFFLVPNKRHVLRCLQLPLLDFPKMFQAIRVPDKSPSQRTSLIKMKMLNFIHLCARELPENRYKF